MAVRGGDKARRVFREMKARRVSLPLIEVGFKDRRIAALAANHEFGLEDADGRVKLPERPAFRNSLPDVQKAMRDELLRIAKATSPFPGYTDADWKRIAVVGRDALRRGYEKGDHGEPLSERQEARKRGTAGEGKQLVGSRGPRMIEHIGAWVNGRRVD